MKARRDGRVRWIEGAPTEPGRYWIVWKGRDGALVEPVEIGGAVISPRGPLLIKTLFGIAYPLDRNASHILHHAPLVEPPLPAAPCAKEREAE